MCYGDLFKDSRLPDIEAHRTTQNGLKNVNKESGFLAQVKEEKRCWNLCSKKLPGSDYNVNPLAGRHSCRDSETERKKLQKPVCSKWNWSWDPTSSQVGLRVEDVTRRRETANSSPSREPKAEEETAFLAAHSGGEGCKGILIYCLTTRAKLRFHKAETRHQKEDLRAPGSGFSS